MSSTGRFSSNFFGHYAISKYGVEAFSDALRREMYPWGIKVSIIEPGGFQTKVNDFRVRETQLRHGWGSLSEELKKDYGEEYLEKSKLSFEFLKCRKLLFRSLKPPRIAMQICDMDEILRKRSNCGVG